MCHRSSLRGGGLYTYRHSLVIHACSIKLLDKVPSLKLSHPRLRMEFFISFIELIDVLGVPPTVLANLSSFYTS